jgi:hypothetical protein
MDEKIKEMLLAPLSGEGSIYKVKKYAIRKSGDEKQAFGPCFLARSGRRATIYEMSTSDESEVVNATDVTGSVDPERQKKFALGPFSYKIVKKL